MRTFLGILCVTLAIQLVIVFSDAEQHVPGRFKAGLDFHQEAGDKASTRSITSSEPGAEWAKSSVQTPIEDEITDLNKEKEASKKKEVNAEAGEDLEDLEDLEDIDHLATRGLEDLDEDLGEDDLDVEGAADHDLETRGLLESGMNMLPSREALSHTVSDLKDRAASIPRAVSDIYHDPQAARESLRNTLSNAKDTVMNSNVRAKMADLYKAGLDKGLDLYKGINQRLSPGMAKTLNQGVSSTMRTIQAAKESPIAKSISEKVAAWLP
ncbi:unnamed protein product [Bemisia tabaci]|uniref:Uncharacterized protein n=1 Tax=Bemisia tabaci TaxID=7038 RepID=A0AAI8UU03_BEMTA|nr:unnamed protein product [Bemisia tabaci]